MWAMAASSQVPDVDAAVNRSGKHRAATLQNRLGELVFEARGSGSMEPVGAQGWCVRPETPAPAAERVAVWGCAVPRAVASVTVLCGFAP